MRIWNLTPHEVRYENKEVLRTFLSDCIARAVQVDTDQRLILGLATVERTYDGVEGLPTEIADGDILIVSTILAEAMVSSKDNRWNNVTILVPDTGPSCKRNSDGVVASVSQFILKWYCLSTASYLSSV